MRAISPFVATHPGSPSIHPEPISAFHDPAGFHVNRPIIGSKQHHGVGLKNSTTGSTFKDRLRSWFPDREFFMRSEGQVRFIKVSSKLQMVSASLALLVGFGWVGSMGFVALDQYMQSSDKRALLEREAQVATAENRVDAYRDDISEVAETLERRQKFLEDMSENLPDDVKARAGAVSDSATEAGELVEKISASIPEAATLARIEVRQIALAEKLTRFADQRAGRAETAIRELGLNPGTMLASARMAQGGPLDMVAGIDPRFERLGLSLARMRALEDGLRGVPQFHPTRTDMISSGFGYRRDPFNGGGAMHSGLDFKGATGAPIYAAAQGRISFVGRKSGYGKVVEITHGNGMMTRYAHMSAFAARVGQQVGAGDRIGAIGSTGRSTGPHLHFEVRINNRAVDPRPFLEAAPDVLEKDSRNQRAAAAAR